jgi:hypothetical protein
MFRRGKITPALVILTHLRNANQYNLLHQVVVQWSLHNGELNYKMPAMAMFQA